MSSFNDNSINTISSASALNTNEMKDLGVVLIVSILGVLCCALTIPICTSAREQPIMLGDIPIPNGYDNTVDNNGYGSNLETIVWTCLSNRYFFRFR